MMAGTQVDSQATKGIVLREYEGWVEVGRSTQQLAACHFHNRKNAPIHNGHKNTEAKKMQHGGILSLVDSYLL